MALSFGENAPWFTAPSPSNPEFVFDTAAGRYVLMLFLPVTTWLRLFLWLGIGMLIYFGYGYHNSVMRHERPQD